MKLFGSTIIVLALATTLWAQVKPPPKPGQPPMPQPGQKPPAPKPAAAKPTVDGSLEGALSNGNSKSWPILIAVSVNPAGQHPPAFDSDELAKASTSSVVLATAKLDEDHEFFKHHKIDKKKCPCILICDHFGNVVDVRPANADGPGLLSAAQSAETKSKSIASDIKRTADHAEAAEKKDDKAGAEKDWKNILGRHLRGFPGIDDARNKLQEIVDARIKKALEKEVDDALKELDAIAKDFDKTFGEALALLEKAKLLKDKKTDKEGAKKLLKHILDDLIWGDCKDARASAKPILDEIK